MQKKILIIGLIISFLLIFSSYKTNRVGFNNEFELTDYINDNENPVIQCLYGNNHTIILLKNGTIWAWGDNTNAMTGLGKGINTKIPNKIGINEKIKSLFQSKCAIFALSENGNLYAWGSNKYLELIADSDQRDCVFYEPFKIPYKNSIIEFDAKINKNFAVDRNGYLYANGFIPPGGISTTTCRNGTMEENKEFYQKYGDLIKDTIAVYAGAGNYDYFVKKDGTVYSIMGKNFEINAGIPEGYIFPTCNDIIRVENPETEAQLIVQNRELGEIYRYYEIEGLNNPKLIASDDYTMFYIDQNNNAYYWYSERLKYKDNLSALYREQSPYLSENKNNIPGMNYEGSFIQINTNTVDAEIVDVKSAKNNSLFLTSTGEVWVSMYSAVGSETIDFYVSGVSKPYAAHIEKKTNVPVYDIFLKKLELSGIKFIGTDGNKQFTAINSNGRIFIWTIEDDEIMSDISEIVILDSSDMIN